MKGKIHKVELYLVDPNGMWNNLDNMIIAMENSLDDVFFHIANKDTRNIEWHDDIDINESDATTEDYERYFKEDGTVKNTIKLRCIDCFEVVRPMKDKLRYMEFIGKFNEGEEYEAVLNKEGIYAVTSSIGKKVCCAFIENDELIIEEGWELIEE